ncbi:hypothetical protein JMUB3935_1568 [Leptotrichia trevisanii]|uniref:Uncharacterized protein n=1 Tax=Leptotrichia trevisanii TaxID=109328 RepID=A0A510KLI8_9FUSO|nr:hypothetical protein [Leptotrichia trevisanii]BBM52589.1 hypothetical protein JMUB3935_1568 [Leptotrichia trevisanii]
MLKTSISFQLNRTKEEKEKLPIDVEAISEFLGKGFEENTYQGNVKFEFNSRFDPPNVVEVLILIGEITNNIEQISNGLNFLLIQLKYLLGKEKFKNYETYLNIKTESRNRTIAENGEINEKIEEKTAKITTSEDLTEKVIQDIVETVTDKIF